MAKSYLERAKLFGGNAVEEIESTVIAEANRVTTQLAK
jgi:hypothetical protein